MTAEPIRSASHSRAFWLVALAFLTTMAFSTVPSPLYPLYQARDGFSTFTVTIIFATYAIGVVASLFFAGHVSDWYGRRRLVLVALALSLASSLVFMLWPDLPGLLLGRIVNGLSIGMLTAAATAWLAELHALARPGTASRRPQLVAGVVNLGGLGLGTATCGVLADHVDHPLVVPYAVFAVAFVVLLVAVALAPETRERPQPMPRYRAQRVAVPPEGRAEYAAAATSAFIALAAFGLFTALAAPLLRTFVDPSRTLAGMTIFAVFAGAVVAQVVVDSWPLHSRLRLGVASIVLGFVVAVAASWIPDPSLAMFLVGGVLAGAGAGIVFQGAIGTVVAIAPPEARAEALAGIFLIGYLGLTVPAVGAGVALNAGATARETLAGFALLVVIAMLAAAPSLLRAPRAA